MPVVSKILLIFSTKCAKKRNYVTLVQTFTNNKMLAKVWVEVVVPLGLQLDEAPPLPVALQWYRPRPFVQSRQFLPVFHPQVVGRKSM
jgi:hypothetical protein